MPASEILLLRHAEKPDRLEDGAGLTSVGTDDNKSLTVCCWQRVGHPAPGHYAVGLLLLALHRDEAYGWPLRRLPDRFGVGSIVLLALANGLT